MKMERNVLDLHNNQVMNNGVQDKTFFVILWSVYLKYFFTVSLFVLVHSQVYWWQNTTSEHGI